MSLISNAIISLSDLKEYLSIGGTTQDSFLEKRINSATNYIENYTNRYWRAREITEVHDVCDTSRVMLDYFPILEVSSVEYWENGAWHNVITNPSDTLADQLMIYLSWFRLRDYSFSKGWSMIKVTYIAGYQDIPEDIQHACTLQAAMDYRKSKLSDDRLGKRSGSVTGASGVSDTFSFTEPKEIEEILNRHRRIPT